MNKAVRVLAAAAVSALVLTGCAQSPTVAATVDGVTVSERAVEEAALAVETALGAPAGEARTFAVNRIIQGKLAETMAADNGIVLSDSERAQILRSQPQLEALATQPGGKALAEDWIDISLVAQALGQEKLVTELAKHDVVVNPRYGQWDIQTGATAGTGSLSTEAPQA